MVVSAKWNKSVMRHIAPPQPLQIPGIVLAYDSMIMWWLYARFGSLKARACVPEVNQSIEPPMANLLPLMPKQVV